jgi:quercetin dioxygenase-like cupin family protein
MSGERSGRQARTGHPRRSVADDKEARKFHRHRFLPTSTAQTRDTHGRFGPRGARKSMWTALAQSVKESLRFTTMNTHQLDQDVFRPALPEDIEWEPFPAFPPSARLAVVVGQPSESAPYVVRVKLPSGVKLMPHRHHEDRVYTVISGVFYIGVGEQFEEEKLEAYPPGAVIVLPGGTPHFHWAKSGEYVTQVTALGPISLEYLDPSDDPRIT